MTLELDRETLQQLIPHVRRYCAERMEHEIGQLEAEFLIEFFVSQLAPVIYNRAIRDAQAVLQERVTELDAILFAVEEDYFERAAPRRR